MITAGSGVVRVRNHEPSECWTLSSQTAAAEGQTLIAAISPTFDWPSIGAIVAAFVSIAIAFLLARGGGVLRFGKLFLRFNPIEREAQQLNVELEGAFKGRDLSERQYVLLRQYHSQGLAQSKISFWFSLVFAALGFGVILLSIASANPQGKWTEQGRSFVTFAAGTIIDAVSALFFVQSNKARQLMTDFFDRLRIDRKLEESLRLAGEIQTQELGGRLKVIWHWI